MITKRRVSRSESPANTQTSYAIVEYFGKYPDEVAPHGNCKHQNTMYTRTNRQILGGKACLNEGRNPRDVYKSMLLEDSFDAPKDFKLFLNVKYQQSTKHNKNKIENINNVADEVLDCISMVDSNEFVQQCSKSKGRVPNYICYTENQRDDLIFFLSQKSEYPIGVDSGFNLGRFFVTALVYKM